MAMKNLKHFLPYLFLRFVCVLLMLLPLRLVYLLAEFIGYLGFYVFRFRRDVVLENLAIAFGMELHEGQRTALAARSYKQIAMTFLELMIAPRLRKQIQQMWTLEQQELLLNLLSQGNGLVCVSGHLGNWEFQGAAIANLLAEHFTVAAVQQSNPYINRFVTRRRNAMSMQVAGSKEAMKLLVRALRNHQAIGLVADQNAGLSAVFVDFFGKTAATMPGPAQLALKYRAPLVVFVALRTGPAKFKVLAEQVPVQEDDTVESLTQRHVKVLESYIRKHPEQYFWLHRRWKTRPSWEEKIEKRESGS
jgi:KDO2-lipid IV(A) lauroyltransferase